jgi:ParB/RepB/Spo0J family partition protein
MTAPSPYQEIPLTALVESPFNPRKTFPAAAIAELAADLKQHGQLQPILVRLEPVSGEGYEIVFGHCRFRAAQVAGLKSLLATVRKLSDQEALEMQLVENSKRIEIHPLEEAEGYEVLHTKHRLSVEEIAAKVGKAPSTVYARMKLCALSKPARKAFYEGWLTPATALMVARLPTPELQQRLLDAIEEETDVDGDTVTPPATWLVRRMLDRGFLLGLKDAPFDRGDGTLVPKAGACTTCPKRTGNQAELFADVKSPDTCTDPACFGAKRDAAWAKKADAARAKGLKVLSDAEAKKAFPYSSSLESRSGFLDLDQTDYADNKRRTYRQILKGQLPPVTIARDSSGRVHELVRQTDANKLLPKNKANTFADDQKRRQQKARAENLALSIALAGIVRACEKREPSDAFWRVLGQGILETSWNDTHKEVCRRRAIEIPKAKGYQRDPAEKALNAELQRLKGGELRALVLELAISRKAGPWNSAKANNGSAFGAACALFGVKLDEARKQVADEAKSKAAAKKKPKPPANKTTKKPTAAKTAKVRTCGYCGCTDTTPCVSKQGEACSWIAADVCSACEGEAE